MDRNSKISGEGPENCSLKKEKTMLEFKIDPKNKTIDLKVDLKGEASPIEIKVTKYEFLHKEGKDFLKIGDVQTSREWINTVLENFVNNSEFEIPGSFSNIVDIIN